MGKTTRFILITVCLLAIVILSSCVDRLYGFDTDYSTGVLLTPEMIESIINADTVAEIDKYPSETDANGELLVYWLPNGAVWHASAKCSTVERANSVESGYISDAIAKGKDRACKVCSDDIDYVIVTGASESTINIETIESEQETDKYPKEYAEDGSLIVYWTNGGSVWHQSSSCSSLANTAKDNLICGNEDQAIAAGKERACKKCS